MIFYCLGIDHKETPLAIREIAYQRREEIRAFWNRIQPGGVSLLTTCNRIEMYGIANDYEEVCHNRRLFLNEFGELFSHAYLWYGLHAVLRHGIRLACGLESQIHGEEQIGDQLHTWCERSTMPHPLAYIWKRALDGAQSIRQQSGWGTIDTDIAAVVYEDMRTHNIFKDAHVDIAVIGTGAVAALIARRFSRRARVHFVSRRNKLRARALSNITEGTVVDRTGLADLCSNVDVVIGATSSPHYVLGTEHVQAASSMRQRKLYLYDLSLPRSIDPSINALRGIVLKNLDDLNVAIQQHNQRHRKHITYTEMLIEEFLERNNNLAHYAYDRRGGGDSE